jgi:hypothetical protein
MTLNSAMLRSCPREKEVSDLVERGQWPQACAPELRDHVSTCRACADLALVAGAFQRARTETIAAAQAGSAKLGSAGALWWRAQLRRRNAAVESIGRPLVSAQIFALVVNLIVAIGFVGIEARHGVAWLNWLQQLPQAASLHLESLRPTGLLDSGWSPMVLIPVAATLALLAGLAVYLAAERQ